MDPISNEGFEAAGLDGHSDVSEAARTQRAEEAANATPKQQTPEEAAGLTGGTNVTDAYNKANGLSSDQVAQPAQDGLQVQSTRDGLTQ